MSHFTVMVVLNEQPTAENDLLAKALQPFHEYECTGTDDEHVVQVDILEEERESEVNCVRLASGELVHKYDDRFWPKGGDGKMQFALPEGAEECKVRNGDLPGLAKRIADDYGIENILGPDHGVPTTGSYIQTDADGNVTAAKRYTNPNKQWDWWVIGGRWSGQLIPKDPQQAFKGDTGVMGSQFDKDGYDGMCVANLDLERMRQQKVESVRSGILSSLERHKISYDDALRLWLAYIDNKEAVYKQWEDLPKEGRPSYPDWLTEQGAGNPVFDARDAGVLDAWGHWGMSLPETVRDPMAYADARPPLTAWAYLQDGVWSEKGSMGWFGMSSGDRDPAQWEDELNRQIEGLPDTASIVMVDCHI